MHNRTGISDPLYELVAKGVEGADSLVELALDMRWSWNHATDDLWEQLESGLWNITQSPWAVLRNASAENFENALRDLGFRNNIRKVLEQSRQAKQDPDLFLRVHPNPSL